MLWAAPKVFAYALLELYPEALSSSLNGAGDTLIRNSPAVYNNPANLIFLFRDEASLSYMLLTEDVQRATAAYAWKRRGLPPFCVDLSYLSMGSVRTFASGENEYTVVETGETSLWFLEAGFSGSASFSFLENTLIFGGRVSFLVNHLDESYTGALLDAGLVYYPAFKGPAFSLLLADAGFIGSFGETARMKARAAVGWRFRQWQTELNCNISEYGIFKWGNSADISRHVRFLFGYAFDRRNAFQNNLRLGAELGLFPYSFSYTIVPGTVLGSSHYFSLKREL